MLLSGIIYGGFYFEYGRIDDGTCEGACENIHSLWTWVFGFLIIFAVVITAGALVGGLMAFFKWSRGTSGTLSALTGEEPEKTDNRHDKD